MGRLGEDELFERFRDRREPAALAELFDRIAPDLLRIGVHVVGRSADAEDLVQQTFLAAIEGAASWQRDRGLFPWLVGILTNQARLRRRAEGRVVDPSRLPQRDVEDPSAAAERAEFEAAIAAAVAELGEVYGAVLRLHLDHGLNAKEIAAALGRPAGSVRTQLVRGLEKLRRALPVGLGVVAVATVGAGRGLAAVRQVVLSAAGKETAVVGAGAAAATVGGVLVMKKVVVASAAVLLAAVAWWAMSTAAGARPSALAGSPPTAAAAELARDAGSSRRVNDAGGLERTSVAAVRGSIRVRVWHERADHSDRAPGAGFTLQAWSGTSELPPLDDTLRTVATSLVGEARLEDLATGAWHVRLLSDGQTLTTSVAADVAAEVAFTGKSSGELQGKVVDVTGTPVAGAEVWLRGTGETWLNVHQAQVPAVGEVRWATRSDMDGSFRVRLAEGEWALCARKAGYPDSLAVPTNGWANATPTLVLGRDPAAIDGSLRDAVGAPVADAVVAAELVREWHRSADGEVYCTQPPRHARTDARGRFTIDDLPAGRWRVLSRQRLQQAEPVLVDVVAGGRVAVDLRLVDTLAVTGRLLAADGTPLAHWPVRATDTRESRGVFEACSTRSDGSFVLAGIPRRRFVVLADQGGHVVAEQWLEPTPEATLLSCELRCSELQVITPLAPAHDAEQGATAGASPDAQQPTGTLRIVTTRRDGAPWHGPLPWYWVSAVGGNDAQVPSGKRDGDDFIVQLPPGKYEAGVQDRDLVAAAQHVDIQANATARLTFAIAIGRSLELTFAGASAVQPIDSRDILHVAVTGNDGASLQENLRRSPHGDGNWLLQRAFAFGRYEVTARSDSGRNYRITLVVRDGLDDPNKIEVPLVR